MITKAIIEIIRAEIRKGPETRAEISRATGVENAVLCRIMQGGDCKTLTADVLLKHFGYRITKGR